MLIELESHGNNHNRAAIWALKKGSLQSVLAWDLKNGSLQSVLTWALKNGSLQSLLFWALREGSLQSSCLSHCLGPRLVKLCGFPPSDQTHKHKQLSLNLCLQSQLGKDLITINWGKGSDINWEINLSPSAGPHLQYHSL